ncbi:MAG: hypothetical protein QNJ91_04955 [Gammaproteobacteria bacterium]|nr:hypothetical protein [Gammaproteobacteria bacterium]
MRLSTLILTTALVFGAGYTGNALAHDYGGRSYGYGYGHYDRDVYRYRRHGHRRGYDRGRRHWRDKRRAFRKHYRPYYRDRDSWYGIHLFLGGH